MGWDGLDEQLLATLKPVKDHGGDPWWLYLGKCNVCGQDWLVAEETRIYDEHFLKRITAEQAGEIIESENWPSDFLTYESVLRVGRSLARPCRFAVPMDPSLIWTVTDLRNERGDIGAEEIAELLGVDLVTVTELIARS
jgi:hypothetical protein